MTKIIIGNHSAVRVSRDQRNDIRSFYCDILGGQISREFDDKDDVRIGDNFYISFLYGAGDRQGADKGVNYAAKDTLSDDDFFESYFFRTENRQR